MVSLFLSRAAFGPRPGRAIPVIAAVALLWLAGCTSYQPVEQYPAWSGGGYGGTIIPSPSYRPSPSYSPPSAPQPSGGSWLVPRAEAEEPPPLRPVSPPELHPVDPDPPALRFLPPVTLSPPADATECIGWWRICHFY
jgi:hypothetical protein